MQFPTTTTPEVTEEEAVESTEIVLVVELYHGLKKHTKTQEFLVLGSQPLTALRDRLYCLTDELAQEAKLNVPSGYFLIEDVFYNDMRNAKAIDYSEPIIKWTRETKEATERWKAVGGAAGGRKSFGTTNQNSDSASLPSFRWYSLVFSVCPASFDAVREGSQTCSDLGTAICLHIGPMKDAKYGDHISLDSKFEVGVNDFLQDSQHGRHFLQ
jgi:hypothetical protein